MTRIKAGEITIQGLFSRENFFIPPYQRDYNWQEENIIQLFKDLKEHFEENIDDDYYIGNIIIYGKRENFENSLVLVDGQQRITTFMLMIAAIKFLANNSKHLDEVEIIRLNEKFQELIIQETSDGKQKIKLSSSREKILTEIIKGDFKNQFWFKNIQEKYKETNYFKNFHIFLKEFEKILTDFNSYKKIISLFNKIILIVIDIQNKKNVHKIFENINSKGINLTLADLIKNFLYILLEEEEHNIDKKNVENTIAEIFENKLKEIKVKREDFFTNYLIFLSNKHFNKKEIKNVYAHFRNFVLEKIKINELKLEEIIQQIEQQINLIKYFENFQTINSSSHYDLSVFLNKENLTSIIFPIVYKVAVLCNIFRENTHEIEVNNNFKNFIILIDKFFSRRYITHSSNKNLNKYTPNLLKKISQFNEYNNEDLEELFTNQNDEYAIGTLMDEKSIVIHKFKTTSCPYKARNSKEIKHIMFKINFFKSKNSNEGMGLNDIEFKKFTVEHIMPQHPRKDSNWIKINNHEYLQLPEEEKNFYENELNYYEAKVQNWGNITITQDNRELSNMDFINKKTIFQDSTLKINNNIANKEEWNINAIEKRKQDLLEIIQNYF